jgi:hypothetical protein
MILSITSNNKFAESNVPFNITPNYLYYYIWYYIPNQIQCKVTDQVIFRLTMYVLNDLSNQVRINTRVNVIEHLSN